VLSKISLNSQVQTILMLNKPPQEFHAIKTKISMNFENEPFDKVLKKLEDFVTQNHTAKGVVSVTTPTVRSIGGGQ
jgi:hypothetical protein